MKGHKRNKCGKVIGLGLLGLGAIAILGNIAQNPNVSPILRFVAETAEGVLRSARALFGELDIANSRQPHSTGRHMGLGPMSPARSVSR